MDHGVLGTQWSPAESCGLAGEAARVPEGQPWGQGRLPPRLSAWAGCPASTPASSPRAPGPLSPRPPRRQLLPEGLPAQMSWRQEGVSPWHVMQAGEGDGPGPVTFTRPLACVPSPGRGAGAWPGSPRAGTEQDWDGVRAWMERPAVTKPLDSAGGRATLPSECGCPELG